MNASAPLSASHSPCHAPTARWCSCGSADVRIDAWPWTVRAQESESTQGYTPFEGIELNGKVKAAFLRGALVCENGKVLGPPRGKYLHRPT